MKPEAEKLRRLTLGYGSTVVGLNVQGGSAPDMAQGVNTIPADSKVFN